MSDILWWPRRSEVCLHCGDLTTYKFKRAPFKKPMSIRSPYFSPRNSSPSHLKIKRVDIHVSSLRLLWSPIRAMFIHDLRGILLCWPAASQVLLGHTCRSNRNFAVFRFRGNHSSISGWICTFNVWPVESIKTVKSVQTMLKWKNMVALKDCCLELRHS